MKKISIEERPDWQATVEREGFNFHTIDGERYWDERGYYLFTEQQITRDLEAPTQELHQMCMDAVGRIVDSEELLRQLAIPEAFFELIRTHGSRVTRTSMHVLTSPTMAAVRQRCTRSMPIPRPA